MQLCSPYGERDRTDGQAHQMASRTWMVHLTIWRAGRGHPISPYGEWDGDVPARHTSSGTRSRSSFGYLWVIRMVEE